MANTTVTSERTADNQLMVTIKTTDIYKIVTSKITYRVTLSDKVGNVSTFRVITPEGTTISGSGSAPYIYEITGAKQDGQYLVAHSNRLYYKKTARTSNYIYSSFRKNWKY